MASRRLFGIIVVLSGSLNAGCNRPAHSAAKSAPPAKVDHAVKEDKLNTIVLTEEAEKRLGLETAAVERRSLRRQQTFGGEIALPASALLTVAAPVSGTLKVVKGQDLPQVGSAVKEGQPMFTLVPHVFTQAEKVTLAQAKLQVEQAQVDADSQVKQAVITLDAAKIDYERAERLFREKADTKKNVDDAQAKLYLAQKGLDAAMDRKRLVDGMKLDTDAGSVKALVIASPRQGIVRATYAVAGEMVPAGSPLFELMNADKVWIKVPVYVGELADIAEGEPALIMNLADAPGKKGVAAKAVRAPPTAQAQASAVDLYYELANGDGRYRPGQRVSAVLTLRGQEKSLGLPWSAVVHDINGGTWVYVQTAPRTYARQRVEVAYVNGNWAVLQRGPEAGAKVVTVGAAEVFGSEFGFGH